MSTTTTTHPPRQRRRAPSDDAPADAPKTAPARTALHPAPDTTPPLAAQPPNSPQPTPANANAPAPTNAPASAAALTLDQEEEYAYLVSLARDWREANATPRQRRREPSAEAGRRRRVAPAPVRAVVLLWLQGRNIRRAAREAGATLGDIMLARDYDPDFRAAYDYVAQARSDWLDADAIDIAHRAAEGEPIEPHLVRFAQFVLERRRRRDYGRDTQLAPTARGNGAPQIIINLSPPAAAAPQVCDQSATASPPPYIIANNL